MPFSLDDEAEGAEFFLIVIGMNRPRLNKILSLVEENHKDGTEEMDRETLPIVKIVPCLAAMSSYEDEMGIPVRYLANVVCEDGSPMTTYFDDPCFAESLHSVLMVGYEWQDLDKAKIKAYFNANQLDIEVDCVESNSEFASLHEEMEAFKLLDKEQKESCLIDGSMGPRKMAQQVQNAILRIKCVRSMNSVEEHDTVPPIQEDVLAEQDTAENSTPDIQEPDYADPDQTRYACRTCRTILFGENNLGKDHERNQHAFRRVASRSTCQSIFCSDEVLRWLSPGGEHIEGKLTCPKCSTKIGHWRWAGAQCSCGTWVTPAIQVPVSKIDIISPASLSQGAKITGVVMPVFVPNTKP